MGNRSSGLEPSEGPGESWFFREGVEVNECPAGFFQIDGKGKITRDMSNGIDYTILDWTLEI